MKNLSTIQQSAKIILVDQQAKIKGGQDNIADIIIVDGEVL